MFSLLPFQRILVAASHVAPTVVLPQGPQGWGSTYTLFPNRSAEMTDGSEKRKHQLTFELQRSRVFKNPTPMRSPLSQKVTWPAATRVLSRGKREKPGNEIIEQSNFSDVPVGQQVFAKKRSRCEMRNGYEACQISLLYFLLAFSDMTVHNVQWHSYHFPFVCLFVVVVVFFSPINPLH